MSEFVAPAANVIIPDSIEPVIGWKSWNIVEDGEGGGILASPNTGMLWIPSELAVAKCSGHRYLDWVLRVADDEEIVDKDDLYSLNLAAGGSSSYVISIPDLPRVIPPAGKWVLVWKSVKCDTPGETCACGIYIAKDKKTAKGYGTILGKVAGWGKVIPASCGYRVQYAYPQELFVDTEEQVQQLAAYSIPVTVKNNSLGVIPLDITRSKKERSISILVALAGLLNLTLGFLGGLEWIDIPNFIVGIAALVTSVSLLLSR